jgi:hypothetical protein
VNMRVGPLPKYWRRLPFLTRLKGRHARPARSTHPGPARKLGHLGIVDHDAPESDAGPCHRGSCESLSVGQQYVGLTTLILAEAITSCTH